MLFEPAFLLHPAHPLRCCWVGGSPAALQIPAVRGPHAYDSLLGTYNSLRPFAVTVFGALELERLSPSVAPEGFNPVLAIVADMGRPLAWMMEQARYPVLTSPLSPGYVLATLWRELPPLIAARDVMHGTVVSVFGVGVLLRGAPGVGKSSLALSLLQRGHRLVVDDAPEVACLPDGQVFAFCPNEIAGQLHVRGLGLLDVCAMFGKAAVVPRHTLDAVIRLVEHSPDNSGQDSLLFGSRTTEVGHKNNMVEWVLSASQTHEPAVWVEMCARTLLVGS